MNFELNILRKIQSFGNPIFDVLFELITVFGEETIVIVILAFIYFTYDKKLGEKIAFSVFGSILLNNALKGIFSLKRPFELYPNDIKVIRKHTATGSSFPSGHTQNASTFYTTLALKMQRRWFWIVVNILIFLIAFSRLYLGVHFPKDVFVGAILGILCAWLGWYLYDKYSQTLKSKIILFTSQLLIFMPFLFFHESLDLPIKMTADFYKIFFIYLGFVLAIFIENKFVHFTLDISMQKKAIRYALAILILLILKFGLKIILPNSLFFTSIRYFLISFVTIGLYPMTFKKLNI